jgi:hypothetical protein
MNDLARIPPVRSLHRRTQALTEASFWELARNFFRVQESIGPLFEHVS